MQKTVLKALQICDLKFFWIIFAELDRKTQKCTSKTSKNEFENFVNIVKFQKTTTFACDFDSLITFFSIQQNRGLPVLNFDRKHLF